MLIAGVGERFSHDGFGHDNGDQHSLSLRPHHLSKALPADEGR